MAPVLRRTAAFKHCESLAKSLLGARAAYVYDHAIYKMPRAQNGTDWHQDEAYGSIAGRLGSLHFWIPLQTVTNETGCMRFIAASHRAGSLKHDRAARSHVRRVPEVDESVATWCPLAAGGITIHTPRTLHATSGNRAGHIRKAWILHFGPWGTLAKLHPLSVIRRCQRTLTELAW
jgi:ectoine hydroxylase-related dioxygenase (phytanoyl-CoA dioxygenase family)